MGLRTGDGTEFLGARGARFTIGAGSVLAKKPPRWVMAAELVETNRLWARVAARIQPEWIERVGGHLVKRSHGDPRWDAERATAMTTERVTLYGLPVVTARPVPWRRVDPAGARDLFIRHALVEGDWAATHAFLAANAARVAEVAALEDRLRRRDLLVDEDARVAFLERPLGSRRRLRRPLRHVVEGRQRGEDPDLLTYPLDVLLDPAAGPFRRRGLPRRLAPGRPHVGAVVRVRAGTVTDGVTVHIPLPVLDRVRATGFDWQVPGGARSS